MMQNGIGRSGPASRFNLGIRALFTIIMLVAVPVALHAQAYYGSIVGNVTDSKGAAVVGAKVVATANATDVKSQTTTSGIGAFALAQLAVGTYTVKISAPGFKEYTANGVEVHVSTNATLDAVLTLGAVSETVTIQADEVQVETTSPQAGEVITGTQIRELPLSGENFVGLTQLSPGVSAAQGSNFVGKGLDGGVNFSVNGNPYNMNLFLVDGVNNNDVGSGRTILVYPSVDTIAEFKMIRNSYGPEYGQAAGAIISLTTKSGQNQFHGGVFYAGRNDALDANNWFSDLDQTPKAEERRDDYGYNISGPVKKDKLFFWFNQEWNKEISGVPLGTCVPTANELAGNFSGYTGTADQCGGAIPSIPVADQSAGSPTTINPAMIDKGGWDMGQFYPAGTTDAAYIKAHGLNNLVYNIPNHLDWMEWNVRGDWDITKSNRGTFRWTNEHWNNPATPSNDGGPFWGSGGFTSINTNWAQPSKSIMGKLSSTISNSMVNDVEFGFGQNRIVTTLGGTNKAVVADEVTSYPATFTSGKTPGEMSVVGWGGLIPYGGIGGNAYAFSSNTDYWNIAPYGNHEDLYTVQDNLSKVKGNHLIKAGIFLSSNEKVEDSGDGADRPGVPTGNGGNCVNTTTVCANGGNTNNPLATLMIPGNQYGVGESSIDAIAPVRWRDMEPYAGDTWKITRNITLTYGARWSLFWEPYADSSGGNTSAVYGTGGNVPNQWANWIPANWSAARAAAAPEDACNGIISVPGTHPCANADSAFNALGVNLNLGADVAGPNKSLVKQNFHTIAPRVGVAWDLLGNGKTALRIGAGQFVQREVVGLAESMAHNAPFVISINTTRPIDSPTAISGGSVSPTYNKDTAGMLPTSWQWNVSIEQELVRNTTLEVGYVGNVGVHLTSQADSNPVAPANRLAFAFGGADNNAQSENALRPATNVGSLGSFRRGGHSNYNALQMLFKAQTGSNSTFQASYTWSHSIGNVAEDDSSGSVDSEQTTDITKPSLDKGSTNINRPNIIVANEVMYLPKLANKNAIVKGVIGGWETNSIITLAEGSSFSVFTNGIAGACTDLTPLVNGSTSCINGAANPAGTPGFANISTLNSLGGTGYSGNNRPMKTGQSCMLGTRGEHAGESLLNYQAFSFVGYQIGTFPAGMASRGSCRGAPNTNIDGQLAKNWVVGEKLRIKFSMDFFDIFNHPNFNSGNLEGAGVGVPTGLGTSGVLCGGTKAPQPGQGASGAPCSAANPIITGWVQQNGTDGNITATTMTSTPAQANAENLNGGRVMQYTLRFSF